MGVGPPRCRGDVENRSGSFLWQDCAKALRGPREPGEHSQRPGSQDDDRRGGGGHRPHRRRREGARGRAGRQGQYPGLCKINSCVGPAPPATSSVASMAWRCDATIRHEGAVNFISAQRSRPARRKGDHVQPGQMVEVSNHSCLPQQKVEVVATNSAWSLSMPLAVFPFLGNCRDDPALCCYACCFPTRLHAEIAEYNGIEGLCHTKSALAQACCVECTAWSMVAGTFLSGCLCPCVCCVPSTRGARTNGRGAFELGSASGARSPARHPPRRIVSIAGAYTSPTLPWSATPSSASGRPTTSSSAGTWRGLRTYRVGHPFGPCFLNSWAGSAAPCCWCPVRVHAVCGPRTGTLTARRPSSAPEALVKHAGIAFFVTGQMPQPNAPRGAPPAADSFHYE